ncbi:NADH-quinone oxidoreductase subunit NuoN [Hyphobacterium sp. HN65]|uniref:NADH-quinone oxidoreductase subunit N n=1 Tax=Hyphobacterium lacteum TaxID=3116575 RepID=A0ABU7LLS5_9PROT|nr:NADH-quinone oxidoreductase subunit NuoN [Hyphobacterium sp. HN65]MEE2524880.1 NADH-quinone oxidoreductase subunit NuoN [Hyphobacterium sp. HN65]
MDLATLTSEYMLFSPEIVLALGAMALLMLGVYIKDHGKAAGLVAPLTAGLLVLAGIVAAFLVPGEGGQAFAGAFIFDPLALFSKIAIFGAAAIALLFAVPYLKAEKLARFEYFVLIALAALGMSMMVSANDLISMYMGVELQSLALYVMAAFNRDSLRASEAGLKYFVLGALSSGLLLYGASLVYGFTGATGFNEIAQAASSGEVNLGLLFGLVFVICGLAFKVSAAPFHMWTPDVYEGSPTPVTAFFATAPKFAAIVLLARVLYEPFGAMTDQWQQVITAIAIASMAVGAFGALTQQNIKRLMAYSSIGNMGYALVAIASGTQTGLWALLAFMILYMIGLVAAFGVVLSMRTSEGMVEQVDDLAGLAQSRPGLAWTMTGAMFSIGGLPFLVGFFGKLFILYAALDAGLVILPIALVLFSVVAAAYYLRIVRVMWFSEPVVNIIGPPGTTGVITNVAGIATAALVIIAPVIFLLARGAGMGPF